MKTNPVIDLKLTDELMRELEMLSEEDREAVKEFLRIKCQKHGKDSVDISVGKEKLKSCKTFKCDLCKRFKVRQSKDLTNMINVCKKQKECKFIKRADLWC